MFCTKCGIELREQDKYCCECGTYSGRGAPPPIHPVQRLTRPAEGGKIGGVCAGFARYFNLDVTLVRVVWLVLTVWPLPLFGMISYIVAWIVMPKEPLPAAVTQLQPANRSTA